MRRHHGFTLIELMIVVAIIGILAAIAYPSYQRYVDRSDRAAAQAFMHEVINRAEQYRLDRRQYPADLATLNVTVPDEVAGRFTITLAPLAGPPPRLRVDATALDPSRQQDMSLRSDGVRTPAELW